MNLRTSSLSDSAFNRMAIASCYLRAGHQSCKETPNGTFGGITLRKALSSPEIWEASSE